MLYSACDSNVPSTQHLLPAICDTVINLLAYPVPAAHLFKVLNKTLSNVLPGDFLGIFHYLHYHALLYITMHHLHYYTLLCITCITCITMHYYALFALLCITCITIHYYALLALPCITMHYYTLFALLYFTMHHLHYYALFALMVHTSSSSLFMIAFFNFNSLIKFSVIFSLLSFFYHQDIFSIRKLQNIITKLHCQSIHIQVL